MRITTTQSRLKNIAVFLYTLAFASPLFAQSDVLPAGMTSLAESILGIMQGGFVKTILIIILCGTAVAYAFNKDNEKIKRNCIAIGIAIAILMGATFIVGAIWDASAP